MYTDPSLLYPNTNANLNLEIARNNISYEDVKKDLYKYLSTAQLDAEQTEIIKRIILLGKAFEYEGNFIAKKLYENWLFGPQTVDWNAHNSNSFSNNFGAEFSSQSHASRPWFKMKWEEVKGISSTIRNLEITAKQDLESRITQNNLPVSLKEKFKNIAQNKKSNIVYDFGDITANSFKSPGIHIDNNTISTHYIRQLWKEKDIGSSLIFGGKNLFTALLYANKYFDEYTSPKAMPDIISSLGSFTVNQYVKGTFTIKKNEENKKIASFKITNLGLRIIDPYDFDGLQPLGCWYPEKGHDLSAIRLFLEKNKKINELDILGVFLECTLYNSNFRNMKNNILKGYNATCPTYKLKCVDYYVLTTMKLLELNKNLPAYEVTL